MATKTLSHTEQHAAIELRDPALSAFLAWLVPGLGHFYQGRRAKGTLFLVCVLGTFCYGLYLGEGRVVYASWKPEHRRLPYLCQLGAGLPALPALVQSYRVGRGVDAIGNWMTPPEVAIPPEYRPRIQTWDLDAEHRRLHRFFELGTVYTMIAGLLNILAIYDAWGGPAYTEHDHGSSGEKKPDSADDARRKKRTT